MKKKIYAKRWLAIKPYRTQSETDVYYIKLANTVKQTLLSQKDLLSVARFNEDEIDFLACYITSYFEDLISETNIWNSFTSKHQELYKKRLPFYTCANYTHNEVNPEDISFLIWTFIHATQTGVLLSANAKYFSQAANAIAQLFDSEYEYAPENKQLLQAYTLPQDVTDFGAISEVAHKILFETYLFFPDTGLHLVKEEAGILKANKEDQTTQIRELHRSLLANSKTQLLGLSGYQWLAAILGQQHQLSQSITETSQRLVGYFLYQSHNPQTISVEHIASGEKFELLTKSFSNNLSALQPNDILDLGIVKWKNDWWVSGLCLRIDYDKDWITTIKQSAESKAQINFLKPEKLAESKFKSTELFLAFLAFNGNSRIAFVERDNVHEYIQQYVKFGEKFVQLSVYEKKEAIQKAKSGETVPRKPTQFQNGVSVVYFNENNGIEVSPSISNAFALPHNPYFDAQTSNEAVANVITAPSVSASLAKYCINNCQQSLPFFNTTIGIEYLQDLDFILRFFKKEAYTQQSTINIA